LGQDFGKAARQVIRYDGDAAEETDRLEQMRPRQREVKSRREKGVQELEKCEASCNEQLHDVVWSVADVNMRDVVQVRVR
jgi:hypothetical protein